LQGGKKRSEEQEQGNMSLILSSALPVYCILRRNDEEKALRLHRKGLEMIARDLELLKGQIETSGSMTEGIDEATRKRESIRVADEIYRLLKRVATTVMRKAYQHDPTKKKYHELLKVAHHIDRVIEDGTFRDFPQVLDQLKIRKKRLQDEKKSSGKGEIPTTIMKFSRPCWLLPETTFSTSMIGL